jgi:integrase
VSLARKPRSPYWHFDFKMRGHRFRGSTKATNKREAQKVESAEREKARATVAQFEAAKTSLRLQDVATRYWREVGEHNTGAADTWHRLGLLIKFFDRGCSLLDIDDSKVAELVAWRRGHPGRRAQLQSPFAVNATIKQLKRLFTRARLWGARFEREPTWHKHMLDEPQERVRELVGDERERLEAATRDDYLPILRFAQATGLRLRECLLKWSEVDWDAGEIRKLGKGRKLVTQKIFPTVHAILWPLRGHHPVMVFTFIASRNRDGRKRGQRYPITYGGLKSRWRYLRKQSGVIDFRFHDIRHDVGTKLLRKTGNLKLVQKALGHANLKTTARYAHVLNDEVAEAMEAVANTHTKVQARLKIVS